MPAADVVVVGAGLSGLVTAHGLAVRGARVIVLAAGMATSHWTAGTIDIAALPGARTARAGVKDLKRTRGHPYELLAGDVEPALDELLPMLASGGLPYVGGLDIPIRAAPTAVGATRPVSVVPDAQAAVLEPWAPDETLVVCGFAGFKDFWADAVAASLGRQDVWSSPTATAGREAEERQGAVENGMSPTRVVSATAVLPNVADRHNLTGIHLARAFDEPTWRNRAIDAIARAIDERRLRRPARVGLPAVLGLRDHAAVLDAIRRRLGVPVFEMPLVPPSVPGLRLFEALRDALRRAGGRLQLGESVSRFEADRRRVTLVATPAAVREYTVRAGSVVLATGGVAAGGLVGEPDGTLRESVFGLPVEAPARDDWFATDPFDPRGHPVARAGIRTDDELRPVDRRDKRIYDNVRVVGSLLAGQDWLRERCGDGVAIASAHLVATRLARAGFAPGPDLPATADATASAVVAGAGPDWEPR